MAHSNHSHIVYKAYKPFTLLISVLRFSGTWIGFWNRRDCSGHIHSILTEYFLDLVEYCGKCVRRRLLKAVAKK